MADKENNSLVRRAFLQSLVVAGGTAALPSVAKAGAKGSDAAGHARHDELPVVPLPAPGRNRIPVAFLLAEGAEVVDFAGPWGVFEYVFPPGMDEAPFQLYTVAESTAPLKVSGGMTIVPDFSLDNAPPPKLIVVPAMGEPSEAMLAWLRRASKATDLTMSVCNGSFVLAKAGLLSGKAATAHHGGGYAMLAADFPDVKVIRGARFVDAGNVSTAGGLTSGIDLALHVVERYYGRKVAEQTATHLEYQGQGWLNPNSNSEFAGPIKQAANHPVCAVCGMEIDRSLSSSHKGRIYYFCVKEHKQIFDASPEQFAAK